MLGGHGNNGRDGVEGVHRDNVIGTYLHGPLLPKNIWLADRLIELALGIELEPLANDELEDAAQAVGASEAAGVDAFRSSVPSTRSTSAIEVMPCTTFARPAS